MNVDLRIGELVVHGLGPIDREALGRAVERELAQLFAERGTPASLEQPGDFPCLDGGSLEIAPGDGSEAVGARVAQAVYGGLSQ